MFILLSFISEDEELFWIFCEELYSSSILSSISDSFSSAWDSSSFSISSWSSFCFEFFEIISVSSFFEIFKSFLSLFSFFSDSDSEFSFINVSPLN
jgi:hypothetical protein